MERFNASSISCLGWLWLSGIFSTSLWTLGFVCLFISSSMKNIFGILVGIVLNLWNTFSNMADFQYQLCNSADSWAFGVFPSSGVFFYFFLQGFRVFITKVSWVRLIFNFIEVIINAVVFLISFSMTSLPVFRESTDFHMLIFVFCHSTKFLNKIYNLIAESFRYFDYFYSSFSPDFFHGLLVFQKCIFQSLRICELPTVSPTSYFQFFHLELVR